MMLFFKSLAFSSFIWLHDVALLFSWFLYTFLPNMVTLFENYPITPICAPNHDCPSTTHISVIAAGCSVVEDDNAPQTRDGRSHVEDSFPFTNHLLQESNPHGVTYILSTINLVETIRIKAALLTSSFCPITF